MTICIAAICRYGYAFDQNYKPTESGGVVVTASDRMLTAREGVEYEPYQMKRATMSKCVEILVAGDLVSHSEIVQRAAREIGPNPNLPVRQVAEIYAKHFRQLRLEQATHTYLSPFGLDMDKFLAQQKNMEQGIALEISNNILNYRLDAEALVFGVEGPAAHIYHMSDSGALTCQDDIGFATIGIGTMHSNSLFMSNCYGNLFPYYTAFPLVYAAKRLAETAPGVGKWTDMSLVTRDGVFYFEQQRIEILRRLYDQHVSTVKDLERKFTTDFGEEDAKYLQQQIAATPLANRSSLPTPQPTTDGQKSQTPSRE